MTTSTVTQLFAKLAIWAGIAFIVLLTALHFLEPELAPSWHFISEYQLGKFGWMMCVAFFSLGLSCISLCIALWRQANLLGKAGLLMLLIAAAGMFLAAINITDPLNTPQAQWTKHGKLHQQGATMDGIPIAATLIIIGIILKSQYWKYKKSLLIWATILVWAGMIVFIAAMVKYFPADRKFGPDVQLGWPNRVMIVTQAVWLIIMAGLTTKNTNQHSDMKKLLA
jgi:hypothetical protein